MTSPRTYVIFSNLLVKLDVTGGSVIFAAATIVAATPIIVLSPLVLASPVLVFTPFLARSNRPVGIAHVKTGCARNLGYLKGFPKLTLHSRPEHSRRRSVNGCRRPTQVASIMRDSIATVAIKSNQACSHP